MKRYLMFVATLLVVLAAYSIVGLQVVPSASGTYAEARGELEDAGFKVIVLDAEGETREPHALEIVVGQSAPAGSVRPFGSAVTLVTRPPQERVTVPDVVGSPLPQAQDSLAAAGLVFESGRVSSQDATVVSTVPDAGAEMPFGSSVFCTVSR